MEKEDTSLEGAASEEDSFTKFSPAPDEEKPSVITKVLTHEWTLAALGALILAVIMTWPTLRYPAYTIPEDVWDPTLEAWMVSWGGHAVSTDITNLWNSNAFFP